MKFKYIGHKSGKFYDLGIVYPEQTYDVIGKRMQELCSKSTNFKLVKTSGKPGKNKKTKGEKKWVLEKCKEEYK